MPRRAKRDPDRSGLGRVWLEQAAVAVSIRDVDGGDLMVNMQFERSFGGSTTAVLPADLAARLRDADRQVMAGGAAREFDAKLADGQGEKHLHCISFPLRDDDGTLFAVGSMFIEPGAAQSELNRLQAALASAAQTNEALRRALLEMEHIAATDRLTGTWNRRRFEDMAVIEMSRAERYAHPVSMMLIDLDHFKQVNDVHGHAVGDAVLQEFVRRVNRAIRKADTLARWGGEEFVVMAPNTRLAEAARLAEKLRARIAAAPFPGVQKQSASIGVAEYQRGEGIDSWLARTDRALYAAKSAGRNRVVADPLTTSLEQAVAHYSGSILQLVWREHYLSGHPVIDAQHRRLFDLANRLLDAISNGVDKETVFVIITALVDAVAEHFADEEAIQRAAGYPDVGHHADEHARLLAKATRFKQYVHKGTMLPTDLFQFLAYEVIAQHLLGADRHYYAYLTQVVVPATPQ